MENLNKFLRKLLIKLLRLDEWHCSSHYDKEFDGTRWKNKWANY